MSTGSDIHESDYTIPYARVPTFTNAGLDFAEDAVFVGRTGAVDLVGGWSEVGGVFKNSGTAVDTEVN